jgi:hypothetical protein
MKDQLSNFIPKTFFLAFIAMLGCNGGHNKCALTCYNSNREPIGFFCPEDVPPCQCFESDGATSQLSKFTQPCDQNVPTGEVKVDEPYVVYTSSKPGVKLYTEFDIYYRDNNVVRNGGAYDSYDQTNYPIYVRFDISDFSLRKYDYKFVITDGQNVTINSILLAGTTPSSDLVRHIDPALCNQEQCPTVGVVKMNINFARMFGTHKITMYKIAHDDVNHTLIEVTSTDFEINREQTADNIFSSNRVLKFVVFKNGTRDLSTHLMGGKTFQQTLSDVFGDDRSNMRFTAITKSLGVPFIDSDGDIMLNKADFIYGDDMDRNVRNAIDKWVERVYKIIEASNPQYMGFAVEAELVKKYDFSFPSPLEDNIFTSQASFFASFLGATLKNSPNTPYYNGLIVLRKKAGEQMATYTTEFNYGLDDMSMRVFYHELGHMWSPSAVTGNNCDGHGAKSKGRNYHECLFHHVCVQEGRSTYATTELWNKAAIKEPKFCEGHKQYFLNRLTVR